MNKIATTDIKKLRELTGVGMQDAATALMEASGDMEKAISLLRKKGVVKAAKKSERIASQGLVDVYVHGGRVGVLVEVNCETDFVAKTDDFKSLVHDVALQIAATAPAYVRREDVPVAVLQSEREIITEQVTREGKPQAMADKVVNGRLEKFYSETCLLEQPSIKDPKVTVNLLVQNAVARLGENIVVSRFARFELGKK